MKDLANNYIVRRSGQMVGTYTDKETAFNESLPGDIVLHVTETHGDYGCITERKINN
jgi:hypothetical protein